MNTHTTLMHALSLLLAIKACIIMASLSLPSNCQASARQPLLKDNQPDLQPAALSQAAHNPGFDDDATASLSFSRHAAAGPKSAASSKGAVEESPDNGADVVPQIHGTEPGRLPEGAPSLVHVTKFARGYEPEPDSPATTVDDDLGTSARSTSVRVKPKANPAVGALEVDGRAGSKRSRNQSTAVGDWRSMPGRDTTDDQQPGLVHYTEVAGRCVCVFDFDETLRIFNGDDPDYPAPDARGIIDQCLADSMGIGIASANNNTAKIKWVLPQVNPTVFTEKFFDSDAFQIGYQNKAESLTAIRKYYRTQPQCMVLFDDTLHNRKYADRTGVIFQHVRNTTGVVWEDRDHAMQKLAQKCSCIRKKAKP